MQYPHWLMVAGAVLVVLGFIGFALESSVALLRETLGLPSTDGVRPLGKKPA
jgi:hypothetical protein